MTEAGVGIYIAGIYLDPLMENLDELEDRFKGLELYGELADRLEDSFNTMNAARAFWVNADAEPKDGAAEDILAMWHGFDSAIQEIEFSNLKALAHTVRRCSRPNTSATDSGLLAALALCYVIEGLGELYDYQVELSQKLITSVPRDLLSEFPDLRQALIQRARAGLISSEIDARVSHADYMGEALRALFAAHIYQSIETEWPSSEGYLITDKMRSAMHRSRAGAGGRNSAKSNKAASDTNAKSVCAKARRYLKLNRDASPSELVKALAETQGLSPPTIIKYLRSQELYPPKK